jgi:hypothetical protein
MSFRWSRPRRLLLPTLLAAVLVGEITGLALARSMAPMAEPDASRNAPIGMTGTARDADRVATAPAGESIAHTARDGLAPAAAAIPAGASGTQGGPRPLPASPAGSTTAATTVSTKAAPSTTSAAYHGRNHVWIPSLGINRSVSSFPCSRTRPPDNYVYRWGCAGRNNVYLLGHSYSVFKPLHDAYVGGRLKKGMKVIYADGAGRVHTYSVIWWRVVAPTTAASWAWAAQAQPSMTLQTCVGARSQSRLMVRLVQVD